MEAKENRICKIWIIGTLFTMIASFIFVAAIIVYIDPVFHYHAPLKKFSYPISDERYQNDGIVRNFKYNGIITGTSMTENFKTSEADETFDATFIKVPFSGAYFKEESDNLKRAYTAGGDIKYVIWSLDAYGLVIDKDTIYREGPLYLYNESLFDDINYVLNKHMLFKVGDVIEYTLSEKETTSFDEYANWNASYTFGKEAVLAEYTLGEKIQTQQVVTEEEKIMLLDNIRQNVTDLAREHPETTFYLFFPPYSICYWDELKNNGQIDRQINVEQLVIEEILEVPNIKLYSFYNNFGLICDLNNYKDQGHYGEWVNSWMLEQMYEEEYLLTKDNYQVYIDTIREFYNSYNYDSLHE